MLLNRIIRRWFNHRSINIRNSLVEENGSLTNFKLDTDKSINWYSCGPTVYDSTHLGHARTYICTDIIRRIMVDFFSIKLNYAMGITDVDDKIIEKARQNNLKTRAEVIEMVRNLENDFFRDMDKLNVVRPDSVLRVTEHIPQILAYIMKLEQQGNAYSTTDGVYFDMSTFVNKYDKFGCTPALESCDIGDSNPSTESVSTTSYSPPVSHNKRHPRDFALWKFVPNFNNENNEIRTNEIQQKSETESKSADSNNNSIKSHSNSLIHWPSPWSVAGRPGWHIECSAMTHALFGDHFDIHSGGVDLKFPHHSNEIAQW